MLRTTVSAVFLGSGCVLVQQHNVCREQVCGEEGGCVSSAWSELGKAGSEVAPARPS